MPRRSRVLPLGLLSLSVVLVLGVLAWPFAIRGESDLRESDAALQLLERLASVQALLDEHSPPRPNDSVHRSLIEHLSKAQPIRAGLSNLPPGTLAAAGSVESGSDSGESLRRLDTDVHVTIRLAPRPDLKEAVLAIRRHADAWFDWPGIARLVQSGLERDLGAGAPGVNEIREYVLERHGSVLEFFFDQRTGTERVEILEARHHRNGDLAVSVALRRGLRTLARVDFRLRPVGADHLIVDLAVEDFSLLKDARSWYFEHWRELPHAR